MQCGTTLEILYYYSLDVSGVRQFLIRCFCITSLTNTKALVDLFLMEQDTVAENSLVTGVPKTADILMTPATQHQRMQQSDSILQLLRAPAMWNSQKHQF